MTVATAEAKTNAFTAAVAYHPHAVASRDSPLTDDHWRVLAGANQRARRIRTASKMAVFNGWMAATFAGVSLILSIASLTSLIVGAALAFVAYNEFRGGKLVRDFDPQGARLLGWNQIGFTALLVIYCIWSIIKGLAGPGPMVSYLGNDPQVTALLNSIQDSYASIYTAMIVVAYSAVMAVGSTFQGLNALFYFTRRPLIEAHVRETPAWVLHIQRQSMPSARNSQPPATS